MNHYTPIDQEWTRKSQSQETSPLKSAAFHSETINASAETRSSNAEASLINSPIEPASYGVPGMNVSAVHKFYWFVLICDLLQLSGRVKRSVHKTCSYTGFTLPVWKKTLSSQKWKSGGRFFCFHAAALSLKDIKSIFFALVCWCSEHMLATSQ